MTTTPNQNVQGGAVHDHLFQVKHGATISAGHYEIVSAINNGCMGTVFKVKRNAKYEKKLKKKEGGVMRRLFDRTRGRSKSPTPPNIKDVMEVVKGDDLRRKTEVYYALKTINLDRIDSPMHIQALENEIGILCSLDHPNLITAYEVYVTDCKMEIITEYCYGGDLYSRYPYSEKDASRISKQILSAVTCMHKEGLIHRELMFENILFENEKPKAAIKLIDFGFAEKYSASLNNIQNYGVERIYSMSPQTLTGVTTKESDMWSIGVLLYMLLLGKKPFHSTSKAVMVDRIKHAEYDKESAKERLSPNAQDLITKLIVVDPKKRLDAPTAMEHEWFTNLESLSDARGGTFGGGSEAFGETVTESLLHYRQTSALKKVALNVIAHRSTAEEILELRKAFEKIDTSHDGTISFDEFKDALKKSTYYSDETVEEIFESIDVNHNGYIMYTEFIASILETRGRIEEERIAEAFDQLDIDGNGYLSSNNLKVVLGKSCGEGMLNDIMNEFDLNHDGKISYQEFKQVFRAKTTALVAEVGRNSDRRQAVHK